MHWQKRPSDSLLSLFATRAAPSLLTKTLFRKSTPKTSRLVLIFPISSAFHPLVISFARSFQLSTVSGLTSPASSATVILQILCCFLKAFSHPFDAVKYLTYKRSAIIINASSWSIVPETGMFEFLQRVYQSQTASFTSEYFATRILFNWLRPRLLSYKAIIDSLPRSVDWICVLPASMSAIILLDNVGCSFA